MIGTKTRVSTAWLLAGAVTLSGCSTFNSIGNTISGKSDVPVGTVGNVQGFLGGVAADEPQAALTGRSVLSAGGNAADAVTAMGFQLAVTLPSRAGLGSGGACLVYNPDRSGPGGGAPEAVLFSSTAPANPGGADRPAGTPMLARGLFALQARYGQRPVETLIVPAEQAAIPAPARCSSQAANRWWKAAHCCSLIWAAPWRRCACPAWATCIRASWRIASKTACRPSAAG
jgi:gamma-glutamyltranspeptidase/glutathione hydrolase